jgi:peroxiredoxin Q/BCP
VAKNAAFAKKFGFNFPLLCDTTRAVGIAYGAADSPRTLWARRISYLIDGEGRVLKAYPKVNAAAHPEEILKDLP